ncbi:dual serine/threonine and tyrosine protein kinase-like isoform X2 [Tubulanus polymorphus]|uniref:dual serine/threonine and tyrosine protein kinase-like isoform X2 n=1 Tax=Tubulanus polymorphus TaxID=672921 RepID=UPI003DA4AD77
MRRSPFSGRPQLRSNHSKTAGASRKEKKMATNLPYELSKFCRHTRQLRHILRDTKCTFQDINQCGYQDGDQILSADLYPEEEEEIENIINQPQCIVVLGQTSNAKANIINDLFSQTILPLVEDHEEVTWRMVRFKYGNQNNLSLSLPGSYELVDNLAAYNQSWRTVPIADLKISDDDTKDVAHGRATLEVTLNHPLLKDGTQVVMSPCRMDYEGTIEQVYQKCTEDVLPILIYAIGADQLYQKDIEELKELKTMAPKTPVFFVQVPSYADSVELTESARHGKSVPVSSRHFATEYQQTAPSSTSRDHASVNIFHQLCDIGYLSLVPKDNTRMRISSGDTTTAEMDSEYVEKFENFTTYLLLFVRQVLQTHLIRAATLLNIAHTRCLRNFIMTAFDMARDMMVTPRKLEFAREKENELYLSLMDIAVKKQDEIRTLIIDTISNMKDTLLTMAAEYDFNGIDSTEDGQITSAKDIKTCTGQIKELILGKLNNAIAVKLVGSVDVLRDSYTGTLTRCLESLERNDRENGESMNTSEALKQILNAAYQVEITVRTSSSLMMLLLEKMKELVQSMPWNTPPKIDREWKKTVACDMISSLSETKLAKSICVQIKERLKNSHEAFATALRQLEARHSGRLEKTEEQRLRVRKVHAPLVARMALESVSLKDMIMFGMPQMGREIGRGQYGVVYSCENWAGHSPCAIKSVVPPDDKHWNDLALEFYYTKNVPEHERLVTIFGSVIDYSYGGGSSPAVLLIMPRAQRDLYTAIKTGLDWPSRNLPPHERVVPIHGAAINYDYGDGYSPEVLLITDLMQGDLQQAIIRGLHWPGRLQVAIDVVEGIRFLHSQGLVHRDIKLKNVLLDKRNRGKITDLGFCKPEAMMSGSIVGTPIHMAPELFTGKYDSSVDVYAFGILFWYVCAGHVRLPYAYEQCTSKDMLWTSVKKGVRPEKLKQFDDECWEMMSACWHGDPIKRPLLGDVEPQLRSIFARTQSINSSRTRTRRSNSMSALIPVDHTEFH